MEAFSKVVLLLHEIGEALVGDVEEVYERLDVARLEQVGAYAFAGIVFVLLRRWERTSCYVLALLIAFGSGQGFVLLGHLVEQDRGTGCFCGLFNRLYLLLLFSNLYNHTLTPSFTSAFIGNSNNNNSNKTITHRPLCSAFLPSIHPISPRPLRVLLINIYPLWYDADVSYNFAWKVKRYLGIIQLKSLFTLGSVIEDIFVLLFIAYLLQKSGELLLSCGTKQAFHLPIR